MRQDCKRISVWSGPRNLSTAMMYSFAQRNDTTVVDEPFYAAYLATTEIKHPMYKEIIRAGEVDAEKVAEYCTTSCPDNMPIFYQKQMTKHMIPTFDRDWIFDVCNIFLIRDPARVIASYHAKDEDPELSDIGIKEQLELFDKLFHKTGETPIVVNSYDILANPEKMLNALCKAIGIKFLPSMLQWPTGPHPFDGVWAPYWYKSVWQSKGFGPPENNLPQIPDHLLNLLEIANGYYDQIKAHTLTIAD
ncbi:MAG: HAD family hydrolase [Gammaproteobacteria bacterium]|nr:HAD family hydrolase [Gammaproteobacteria bacterium]